MNEAKGVHKDGSGSVRTSESCRHRSVSPKNKPHPSLGLVTLAISLDEEAEMARSFEGRTIDAASEDDYTSSEQRGADRP